MGLEELRDKRALRTVQALQDNLEADGARWSLWCTVAALQALSFMCAQHPPLQPGAPAACDHPFLCC